MSILIILSVLLGLAAVAITLLKPGANSQAIRALGVASIFAFAGPFWISLVAVAWALIEYAIGNGMITTSKPKKGKKK